MNDLPNFAAVAIVSLLTFLVTGKGFMQKINRYRPYIDRAMGVALILVAMHLFFM